MTVVSALSRSSSTTRTLHGSLFTGSLRYHLSGARRVEERFSFSNPLARPRGCPATRGSAQRLNRPALVNPSQTAPRQSTTEPPTFNTAGPRAPLRARFSVSKLKDENVVKPPSTPTSKNARASAPNKSRPPDATSAASSPIVNEPVTLTNSVPYGNPAPSQRAATP